MIRTIYGKSFATYVYCRYLL